MTQTITKLLASAALFAVAACSDDDGPSNATATDTSVAPPVSFAAKAEPVVPPANPATTTPSRIDAPPVRPPLPFHR